MRRFGNAAARGFVLLAAAAALITAGVDGCSRRMRHPLRPHKEPHAQAQSLAPDQAPPRDR